MFEYVCSWTVDNDQNLKTQAAATVQSCKEQIKEFIKSYSDKHKDLHANVSKIGKVIDKVNQNLKMYFKKVSHFSKHTLNKQNFVSDYGNLPQINIFDTPDKQVLLNQVIHEHLLRNGHTEIADSLTNVITSWTHHKTCVLYFSVFEI